MFVPSLLLQDDADQKHNSVDGKGDQSMYQIAGMNWFTVGGRIVTNVNFGEPDESCDFHQNIVSSLC